VPLTSDVDVAALVTALFAAAMCVSDFVRIGRYTGWAKKWSRRLTTIILSNLNRKKISLENSYVNS